MRGILRRPTRPKASSGDGSARSYSSSRSATASFAFLLLKEVKGQMDSVDSPRLCILLASERTGCELVALKRSFMAGFDVPCPSKARATYGDFRRLLFRLGIILHFDVLKVFTSRRVNGAHGGGGRRCFRFYASSMQLSIR